MSAVNAPFSESTVERLGNAAADVVFTGGPVLTMDAARPRAESVAVRGGRITAVGSSREVSGLVGTDTEVVDLDGRALLPGFIDPHMHSAMVQLADWVDVSPMASPTADDVFTALRDATAAPTGWVLAQQFDPSITRGHPRLDRVVLDRLIPDRPVLVLESNGHVAQVNSEALIRAGVNRDTPDPPRARFVRDAGGELTGRLEESAAVTPFTVGFPMVGGDALVGRIEDLLWHSAGKGVTLLHDCGIGSIDGTSDLEVLQRAVGAGSPVRYRGMLVSTEYDGWSQMGLKPGFGDDMFRVDGIKAWSDGSNQAGTGYQREPYLGTDSRGTLNYSAQDLAQVVLRAHRDGWQVGVHANGDAAIDVTIDAFEQALSAHPRADHRHRIEHCSVLRPEHITRMAALGLSPSFLIGHIRWWGAAFRDRLLGPERAAFYDPCASALRGGLRISLHSDWNVTPIEPLRYVHDAVTRIMVENGEVLSADERISVDAALRAITIDAAWQCRSDDTTGSIEVGKYADLVLLEDDPTTVDPTSIAAIPVSQTRLAGNIRFSA
ncbi:MAG: amidohydrolase [Nakamurella sp.]